MGPPSFVAVCVQYVLTSTLPDPTGNLEHYRGTLNPELAKQVGRSVGQSDNRTRVRTTAACSSATRLGLREGGTEGG